MPKTGSNAGQQGFNCVKACRHAFPVIGRLSLKCLSLAIGIVITVATNGFADTIILKGGKPPIVGEILKDTGRELVVRETATGKELRIPADQVAEIRPSALKKAGPSQPWTAAMQPRIGTLQGALVPMGDIADALGIGYYGRIFSDVLLPVFDPASSRAALRAGLSLGYGMASSKSGDAKLSLMTALAYGEISYLFPETGIRPFGGLQFGVMMPNLTKDTDDDTIKESSTDATVAVNAGVAYHLPQLPDLEIIADLSYLTAFEEVNGQFLSISLGVSYKFSANKGDTNEAH